MSYNSPSRTCSCCNSSVWRRLEENDAWWEMSLNEEEEECEVPWRLEQKLVARLRQQHPAAPLTWQSCQPVSEQPDEVMMCGDDGASTTAQTLSRWAEMCKTHLQQSTCPGKAPSQRRTHLFLDPSGQCHESRTDGMQESQRTERPQP